MLSGFAALLISERLSNMGRSAAVAIHGRAALALDSVLTELQRDAIAPRFISRDRG